MDAEKALEPVIVSASRSTDVPAFYAGWFLARLREGWCEWRNPFNGETRRVSFAKTRAVVFWSKNPKPMLARLDELEALGCRNYYFQFTLNDYDKERLEPNVPCVGERLETFAALAERLGKARVVWRFDPLVLMDGVGASELLERARRIGDALKGLTEKMVFSFVDIAAYRKVRANLAGTSCREFSAEERARFVEGLLELNRDWGFTLATCGEEASFPGIVHNKCIDDELLMRLFNRDAELMKFIGAECDMFSGWHIDKSRKDKGQRKTCGCIASKDIGAYNTCPHLCRYCYANASDAQVMANWNRFCLRGVTGCARIGA